MEVTHPRLSPEEFAWLMGDRGWDAPMEHLDGEVVVTPPGGGSHGMAVNILAATVHGWQVHTGDRGLVLLDVFLLIGMDTLAPDLAFWCADRRPHVGPGRIDEPAPDLVVEIASPSTVANDIGPKRIAYTRAGVAEQWLLNPANRSAILVDRAGASVALDAHQTLTSAVLSGFEMTVGALFDET